MIGSPPPTSPGWRRVAAFAVDYGVILAYLGLLALVGVLGRAVGCCPPRSRPPAPVAAPDHRMTPFESPLRRVVPPHSTHRAW
jgi:hypothetical protein